MSLLSVYFWLTATCFVLKIDVSFKSYLEEVRLNSMVKRQIKIHSQNCAQFIHLQLARVFYSRWSRKKNYWKWKHNGYFIFNFDTDQTPEIAQVLTKTDILLIIVSAWLRTHNLSVWELKPHKFLLLNITLQLWRPYLAGIVLIKRSWNLSGTTRLEESADRILCWGGFKTF